MSESAIMERPPTAQINVRINRSLKEAGDLSLARCEVSPSQIVRELWECLAQGTDAVDHVRDAFSSYGEGPAGEQQVRQKVTAVQRMTTLHDSFAKEHALDESLAPAHAADEDWHELVWTEREGKWLEGSMA